MPAFITLSLFHLAADISFAILYWLIFLSDYHCCRPFSLIDVIALD